MITICLFILLSSSDTYTLLYLKPLQTPVVYRFPLYAIKKYKTKGKKILLVAVKMTLTRDILLSIIWMSLKPTCKPLYASFGVNNSLAYEVSTSST